MADKGLILSGDPWSMTDEKTGQMLNGFSVWFVNEYDRGANGQLSLGFKPTKINATAEIFEQLRGNPVPGLYEMDFGSRPGAGGKAALTLTGIKFIGTPNLFGKTVQKAAA